MTDCKPDGAIESTRAASEALSRDHLNWARVVPPPPVSVPAVWISTRYSRFSRPV